MLKEELTLCPCLFPRNHTVQGLAPQALVSGLCPEGQVLQHSDHSPAAQLAREASAGTEQKHLLGSSVDDGNESG